MVYTTKVWFQFFLFVYVSRPINHQPTIGFTKSRCYSLSMMLWKKMVFAMFTVAMNGMHVQFHKCKCVFVLMLTESAPILETLDDVPQIMLGFFVQFLNPQ